ncbi:MAG: hypothetical protein U1F25_17245 [Rubrivivax sp.]
MRTGRGLDEAGSSAASAAELPPALVSAAFADARSAKPGARLSALINGRQRTLVVSGIRAVTRSSASSPA